MTPITDAALVQALAHPLRVQILSILEHRVASPSDLAEELGAPLANVSYHVVQLKRLKLISLAREVRRRGAIEHYYKLEQRPSISDEGWAGAPTVVKRAVSSAVIEQIGTEVERAASDGAFDRDDIHLSRLPVTVDERGFQALAREAERFVAKVKQIEDASTKRIGDRADGRLPARVMVMLFPATEPASDGAATPRRTRRGSATGAKKKTKT